MKGLGLDSICYLWGLIAYNIYYDGKKKTVKPELCHSCSKGGLLRASSRVPPIKSGSKSK